MLRYRFISMNAHQKVVPKSPGFLQILHMPVMEKVTHHIHINSLHDFGHSSALLPALGWPKMTDSTPTIEADDLSLVSL